MPHLWGRFLVEAKGKEGVNMQRPSTTGILFGMALLIVATSSIGVALVYYFNLASLVALVIISDAAITFSSLLMLCHSERPEAQLSEAAMRTAIAGTIVMVYLVLLSIATVDIVPGQHSPLSDTLITSFTSIVGVVIASYFGASAYVQTRSKVADGEKTAAPSGSAGRGDKPSA
jgi:hypothetical protein